ncbi:MAG: biotin--[acetyl-CoA-carboxylase] ligase [Candidatus Sericytochromatia bacterium]
MKQPIAWQIQAFEQLDSTQSWLCRQAEQLPSGTCILASCQSAGLGREARSWESAPGGLYASFLLKPERILAELPWALCWAVLEALEQTSGLELTLKAPNDLLVDGRKLAGMLIDSRILQARPLYYVCGLGINLNQRDFGPELAQRAVSLYQLSGRESDPAQVIEQVLGRFGAIYALLGSGRFAAEMLAALGRRRVQIGYNGREFTSFEEYWHEHGRS